MEEVRLRMKMKRIGVLVGWWVLVGGAVVGLGEVGSGGVAATAAAAGSLLLMGALYQSKTAKRGLERALVKGNQVHT